MPRLLVGQALGRPDVHADVQVAVTALPEPRQALPLEPEHRSRLGAGRDDDERLVRRGGHPELEPERRLGERHRQVVNQVVALPLEALVVLDLEHDDQVAGRSAAHAGRTLPAQREVVVRRHAGRDLHRHRALGAHPAVAPADLARLP